ncbi:hypothetical protein Cgig2_019623 [Carnegiea gigantea]|uniref:Aldehyde dehydrogenase n=1 Tax=Carnegiea gigantea TaxID=171969 RepID=A0A9Q1QJC3_9CARY|nr:hypothetical protein Cgig2_019623 [Carnegiea gigantea]
MVEERDSSCLLSELRETFKSGRTRSFEWRKTQLEAMLNMLTHQEHSCFQALDHDLGKTHVESYKDEAETRLLFYPAKAEVIPEPYGLVLIITSWNYPLQLALEPLIGAIAAGNVVVIKPSEIAPATSSFLSKTIPLYLDSTAIKVIEGGSDTTQQLLQHQWDKIFYTGSPRVGKIIMTEAAKHLTPVTLELGGKCPMIFDFPSISSDLKIDMLKRTVRRFYGENLETLKGMTRIVNKFHFDRLRGLLKDPLVANSIVHGGSYDEERLYLKKIVESIEFINSKPKPLALYAFTNDESLKTRIVSETSSGSVTFNDVLIHCLCDGLPFGGVGPSGIGRYHGKYSFETFSHEKAVLRRGFFPDLNARYPPWNTFKLEFCRVGYRFDYIALILLLLGLKSFPKES